MLVMVVAAVGLRAQSVSDSLRVSLLTCSPGDEVYQLYGHTALRVVDREQGLDVVFNYGVFDFRAPHFVWRFVLGECDYQVMAYPFEAFLEEYRVRGSQVMEQQLALMPDETLRLCRNLFTNAQPQNRTYRYNFLSNNCTTRARDMVEQAVDGYVVYAEVEQPATYRTLLHHYTHGHPWAEVGNDMLLGAACDTVLSGRASQFLPEQLMNSLATAQIYDAQSNRRPLVGATRVILPACPKPVPVEDWQDVLLQRATPRACALALLAVCLLTMAAEWRWRRMWWGLDVLLLTAQGVVGTLLCFMFLFSQHPTLDSNWQVLVLNPLPLVCMPWVVRCAWHRRRCAYHYVAVVVLLFFMVSMPWMPQIFSAPMLPLALALWSRTVSYQMNINRLKKK